MAIYKLNNGEISIQIESLGAELKSLKDMSTDREYMWEGRKEFWGRTSPVLFPIVGGLKNKEYRYDGTTYPMSQHGFARDMEFRLKEETDTLLTFVLESDEKTKLVYPFSFELELSYELVGRNVVVGWKVINKENGAIYFSIGGHPAFNCPLLEGTDQNEYFLEFDVKDKLICTEINQDGLVKVEKKEVILEDGILAISQELFSKDALVFEHGQTHSIALLTPDKKAYLTVEFEAPVVGVWSPPGKNAPFICIEPWYGRCDGESFAGSLEEREWGNCILAGEVFEKSYVIQI